MSELCYKDSRTHKQLTNYLKNAFIYYKNRARTQKQENKTRLLLLMLLPLLWLRLRLTQLHVLRLLLLLLLLPLQLSAISNSLVLYTELLSGLQCTNKHQQEVLATEQLVKPVILQLLKATKPTLWLQYTDIIQLLTSASQSHQTDFVATTHRHSSTTDSSFSKPPNRLCGYNTQT